MKNVSIAAIKPKLLSVITKPRMNPIHIENDATSCQLAKVKGRNEINASTIIL